MTGPDIIEGDDREAIHYETVRGVTFPIEPGMSRMRREIERKKAVITAQIAALNAQFEVEKEELDRLIAREHQRAATQGEESTLLAKARQADIGDAS